MVNVDFVCEILDKFGFEGDPVARLGKLSLLSFYFHELA